MIGLDDVDGEVEDELPVDDDSVIAADEKVSQMSLNG